METTKRYQFSPSKPLLRKKPGPKQQLGLDDEVLLVLMRTSSDSPIVDLAFRFKISAGHASKFFRTIAIFFTQRINTINFLAKPEPTLSYKHPHFPGDFNKVEGIGACNEQWIQRSSNPKAQYQTHSTYKSYNAVKKLVICTKSGSISYISDAHAGLATDRFITENTNIAAQFTPAYFVLFHKGFNVHDLFLWYKGTAGVPPFIRSKRQLTPSEVAVGRRITRARIVIEDVTGQLKMFRLLDRTLPSHLFDLVDEIWIIACVITNMQPPLLEN